MKQKAWEVEPKEMRKFLDAPDGRTVQGKRDRSILTLLAFTGIRRAELCNLTIADLDLDQPSVSIQTLKQRSKGKPRTITLKPEVVKVLQTYLQTRQNGKALKPADPLFETTGRHGPWKPKALTPGRVNYIVKRTLDRAGIRVAITPHSLRHNFATQLLRSKRDLKEIQDLLGHRQISSTSIYLHSHPSRLREAVEQVKIA